MANGSAPKVLLERLTGIQQILMAHYAAGTAMSSATKGREREIFVRMFLSEILPPLYRFGSGDIVDVDGNCSGQMDVVIENAFLPSLPCGAPTERLYLAEGVAAVLEIKSAFPAKEDIRIIVEKLNHLKRRWGDCIFRAEKPPQEIPYYVVSYRGSDNESSAKAFLTETNAYGLLIVEHQLFAHRGPKGCWTRNGPEALWEFVSCLYELTTNLIFAGAHPRTYIDKSWSLQGWPTVIEGSTVHKGGIEIRS